MRGAVSDPARLRALEATGLLDSEPEEVFDRFTRLARRLLRTKSAFVSVVDDRRQYLKSAALPEGEVREWDTQLSHSFCKLVAESGEALVVEDARTDDRVKDNGSTTERGVVAYAGAPLQDPSGFVLGAFCVLESEPRSWTPDELVTLADLASAVEAEIALRVSLRRLAKLEKDQRLHGEVVRNMSEGLCLVRVRDGVILYANPKFERMLGYDLGELAGSPVHVVNYGDPDEALRTAERLTRQIAEQGEATYEVRNVTKDGRRILCRATSSIMHDDEHGDIIVAVQGDVTEERRLDDEREHFFNLSPDLMAVIDGEGRFKRINRAWESTLGFARSELVETQWQQWIHPDDLARNLELAADTAPSADTPGFAQNRYVTKSGEYRWLEWRWARAKDSPLLYSTARDVTEQHERDVMLRASLRDKEALLSEVHHRVKNNLQVVTSLLKLQSEQVTDPAARAAFRESKNRVRSIGLLHELLYRTKDFATIGLASYAHDLSRAILRAVAGNSAPELSIEAAGVELPLELAVPCGLILNELLTNSVKHAFDDTIVRPRIEVRATVIDGDVELVVSDNGRGFPETSAAAPTLGVHLIRSLSRQLRAEHRVETNGGTRWTFRFPLAAPKS